MAKFDVAIIGSSFSGALLGWILAKAGRKVILLDKQSHPRFAIGESSTPIADLLLERISQEFEIPELNSMSRWGIWQRDMPNVAAGKKRGFSYFQHVQNEHFCESARHERSLLVAASATDATSDTHWFRSEVDQWIIQQAISAGAESVSGFEIQELCPSGSSSLGSSWEISGTRGEEPSKIVADFLVDSSGASSPLAKSLGIGDANHSLRVANSALYGHFRNMGSFDELLTDRSPESVPFPFASDDAAQHHLIDEGWCWMLRFNNQITSAGIVFSDKNFDASSLGEPQRNLDVWRAVLERYPSIAQLFNEATLVAPCISGAPQLGWIPRMSRLWNQCADARCEITPPWAMLPATAGIVDPLHSTGIAHSLYGVRRVARILLGKEYSQQFASYSREVGREIRWIDQVVDCCYQAARLGFRPFAAACNLYFVCAIHCERQLAETNELSDGLLMCQHEEIREIGHAMQNALRAATSTGSHIQNAELTSTIRRHLQPWDDVGLFEASLNNRISRSIAPKA